MWDRRRDGLRGADLMKIYFNEDAKRWRKESGPSGAVLLMSGALSTDMQGVHGYWAWMDKSRMKLILEDEAVEIRRELKQLDLR